MKKNVIRINENQLKKIIAESVRNILKEKKKNPNPFNHKLNEGFEEIDEEQWIGDVPLKEIAPKVWDGEIETITGFQDPKIGKENVFHIGNVIGEGPWDMCGRLYKGAESGKTYFFEM